MPDKSKDAAAGEQGILNSLGRDCIHVSVNFKQPPLSDFMEFSMTLEKESGKNSPTDSVPSMAPFNPHGIWTDLRKKPRWQKD